MTALVYSRAPFSNTSINTAFGDLFAWVLISNDLSSLDCACSVNTPLVEHARSLLENYNLLCPCIGGANRYMRFHDVIEVVICNKTCDQTWYLSLLSWFSLYPGHEEYEILNITSSHLVFYWGNSYEDRLGTLELPLKNSK